MALVVAISLPPVTLIAAKDSVPPAREILRCAQNDKWMTLCPLCAYDHERNLRHRESRRRFAILERHAGNADDLRHGRRRGAGLGDQFDQRPVSADESLDSLRKPFH